MTIQSNSVFINNRTQAVRLPTDMRLPADTQRALIRVQGQERIISPAGHSWDSFFADGPLASDDFMDTRATQTQAERETL